MSGDKRKQSLYFPEEMLEEIKAAGAAWQPKAAEVTAVLVTKDTVEAFLAEHPEAIQ